MAAAAAASSFHLKSAFPALFPPPPPPPPPHPALSLSQRSDAPQPTVSTSLLSPQRSAFTVVDARALTQPAFAAQKADECGSVSEARSSDGETQSCHDVPKANGDEEVKQEADSKSSRRSVSPDQGEDVKRQRMSESDGKHGQFDMTSYFVL